MAMGRPPKPTALKLLEGNPGKRALNRNEPKPQPIAPRAPLWLNADARREWRRVAPELERLGLLTRVDMAALASYCEAYALLMRAAKAIDAEGLVLTSQSGYAQPHPAVGIVQRSMQNIRAFCSEFGLTPSSRGRMSLPEPETDDLDALLRGSG